MKLIQVRCTNCGYPAQLDLTQKQYKCEACMSSFLTVHGHHLDGQSNSDIETVKNNRQNLKRALTANDLNSILHHSQNILNILPNDFKALYYNAHASARLTSPKAIQNFLNYHEYDATQDDLNEVVDHIMKYIDLRDRISALDFIEILAPNKKIEAEKFIDYRITKENDYAVVKRDVFICYRSIEKSIAQEVLRVLENDGQTCWISERNLRPDDNENYWKNITSAIKNCEIFLVVSSKDAMLSHDIQEELTIALNLNKKRLEYKIDESIHTTQFRQFFSGIKWINASHEPALEELKERVFELRQSSVNLYEKENQGYDNGDLENKYESLDNILSKATKNYNQAESLDVLIEQAYFELDIENFDTAAGIAEKIYKLDIKNLDGWLIKFLVTFRYSSFKEFERSIENVSLKQLYEFRKDSSYKAIERIDHRHEKVKLCDVISDAILEKAKDFKIGFGNFRSCLLTPDRQLFMWGSFLHGELGLNELEIEQLYYENKEKAYLPNPKNITSHINLEKNEEIVDFGTDHMNSTVLTSDGRLIAWRLNFDGQISSTSPEDSYIPIDVTNFFDLKPNEKIMNSIFSRRFSMVITSFHRIFAWGEDIKLIKSTNKNKKIKKIPIEISDEFGLEIDERFISSSKIEYYEDVDHISTTNRKFYMLLVTSKGRVFNFGYELYSNQSQLNWIIPINQSDITSQFDLNLDELIISVTSEFSNEVPNFTAVTSEGRVFFWRSRELLISEKHRGDHNINYSKYDITKRYDLFTDEKIILVTNRLSHYYYLTSLGRILYLYGPYSEYRFEDSTTDITSNFDLDTKEKIISIQSTPYVTFVITSNGRVFSFGSNYHGQVGDGTFTDRSKPVDITSQFNK